MRYLFLLSYKEWNGTVRAFTDVAEELARDGEETWVVTDAQSDAERAVSALAVTGGYKNTFEAVSLDRSRLVFLDANRLSSLLKRLRIDVVFVHSRRDHVIAALAVRIAGRGVVVRRLAPGETLNRGWVEGRFASLLSRPGFLFSTEADRETSPIPRRAAASYVAHLGVAPSSDKVIPPTEPRYIVCVNDDSSRSRAAVAIRALAMLLPNHPGLRLIIVGEGRYEDELRMQAAALRILNLVSFVGQRGDELNVLRKATLGWVVSQGDTGAYATLDFMSLGVPVIAQAGSVSEHYTYTIITGVLFESSDQNYIAASIAGLLSDPERLKVMGAASMSRVRRDFNINAMAQKFKEIAIATIRSR